MSIWERLEKLIEDLEDSIEDGTFRDYMILTTIASILWSILAYVLSNSIISMITAFLADEAIYAVGYVILIAISDP